MSFAQPTTKVSAAKLRCIVCADTPETLAPDFRCVRCGELLEVFYPGWTAESGYDREAAAHFKRLWKGRRSSSRAIDLSGVWRFRELLPILADPEQAITIREGNTPLYELPRCARSAGMDPGTVLAKHQGMNPTGSFKDTGMTAALSVAKSKGFSWVACASTGNTSASMAAYAARAGLSSVVLIPEGKIAWGKLSQALEYGAITCQLNTDFDGCMRVLNEVVKRLPVYLLNSVNPYRLEGQKTAAIELMEQVDWTPPAHLIAPGGNLGNSSALGKGLLELHALGFIPCLPKISVIQAKGANALVRTMRETGGKHLIEVKAETAATAIRIGAPASWRKAVHAIQSTGGTVEEVSETEIAIAKAEIGADGIGCEPASATTLAGLKKLVASGFVKPGESVVLVLTGHLLKDPEYTLNFHKGEFPPKEAASGYDDELRKLRKPPFVIPASADALVEILEREGKFGG